MNMLRETIMGRELFDYAFKEYARRWAFKHPTPADFFRTMNDASAENLDWFWRGWFYGTDAVDISLDSVKHFSADFNNPPAKVDSFAARSITPPMKSKFPEDVSKERNATDKNIVFAVDADTTLRDFYWRYVRGEVPYDTTKFQDHIVQYDEPMDDATRQKIANKQFYELQFSNIRVD